MSEALAEPVAGHCIIDAAAQRELIELVYREARLIDDRRFDDWLSLFADDAIYWVPLTPDQPDGEDHASLMYEDRMLLSLRIGRFADPRAHSLHPPVRCLHVLQRPEIEPQAVTGPLPQPAQSVVRSNQIYVETQGDRQLVLATVVRHTVVRIAGVLRIRCKRIDLLNADSPLPAIQLFP